MVKIIPTSSARSIFDQKMAGGGRVSYLGYDGRTGKVKSFRTFSASGDFRFLS